MPGEKGSGKSRQSRSSAEVSQFGVGEIRGRGRNRNSDELLVDSGFRGADSGAAKASVVGKNGPPQMDLSCCSKSAVSNDFGLSSSRYLIFHQSFHVPLRTPLFRTSAAPPRSSTLHRTDSDFSLLQQPASCRIFYCRPAIWICLLESAYSDLCLG